MKTRPPAALRAAAAVACCRRAFITRTEQHSALSAQSFILGTGMYACTAVYSSFGFLHWLSSLGPLRVFLFSKLHPYFRLERDIASKHTVQHRAINSAQAALGIIKSLVAPKSWVSSLCPFHIMLYYLRKRSRRVAEPLYKHTKAPQLRSSLASRIHWCSPCWEDTGALRLRQVHTWRPWHRCCCWTFLSHRQVCSQVPWRSAEFKRSGTNKISMCRFASSSIPEVWRFGVTS